MSTMKGMLTYRKQITQYDLRCRCCSTDWWADLATIMTHLTWLELFVGEEVDDVVETPFALQGLLIFTYLCPRVNRNCYEEHLHPSLSLQLPTLQTLKLWDLVDMYLPREASEVDLECPSLLSLRIIFHEKLSMSTSWFAHLRFLDLRLHAVSACLCNEYCRVINLGVF